GPVATLDQTLWTITGLNKGAVGAVGFTSFENLTGQDSTSDAFVFAAGASITGTIAGGTGSTDGFAVVDSLGLLAYQPGGPDSSGTTSLGSGLIHFTGMDAYTRFSGTAGAGVGSIHVYGGKGDDTFTVNDVIAAPIEIFGNDGTDELIGPSVDFIWIVTGDDAGTGGTNFLKFDTVEKLTGRAGADGFQITGGKISGGIDGGGGSDTLVGPDTAPSGGGPNLWTVDWLEIPPSTGVFTNGGTLNGGTTEATPFLSIEKLVGGAA